MASYKGSFLATKGLILATGVIGVIIIFSALYRVEWSGFGTSENKSETIEEVINPKNGKLVKLKKITTNFDSGKKLWDWLGLGVTLAIPIVLYKFQSDEQERSDARIIADNLQNQVQILADNKRNQDRIDAEKLIANQRAENEKQRANNHLHEEALQAYIDRVSSLLLDYDLKTLPENNPLRIQALNVVRARTLSILRRLKRDRIRQKSVIWFLIEIGLISELKLSFSDADFAYADLTGADLRNVCFRYAKFNRAILYDVNFDGADLRNADFRYAKFSRKTNLSGAKLSEANLNKVEIGFGIEIIDSRETRFNLSYSKLDGADLENADLTGADLGSANLGGANLKNATLTDAKLVDADLTNTDLRGVKGLTPQQVRMAKNWEKAMYDVEFRQKLS
jgi:Pentapeptide repeats (8 copies)/Pentapeptide repeats (9 copies)